MIRACAAWTLTGYLVTIIAFGLLGLLAGASSSVTEAFGNCLFAMLMAAVFAPLFVVPTAVVAGISECFWRNRPSNLVLGLALGFVAMVWTLWPPFPLIGAIAGGTAGWLRDRDVALLSGRWLAVAVVGGILAGVAGLVSYPVSAMIG